MSADPGSLWRGTLLLGQGTVVYLGPGGAAARHRHHAVQIAVTWDEPLTVEMPDTTLHAHGVVVPSDVPHRLATAARQLAVVFVDPESVAGRRLDALARTAPPATLARLVTNLDVPGDPTAASRFAATAIGELTSLAASHGGPRSAPVAAALDHVARTLPARPALADAARAAHLSPSRLTHVFTREVGLPFRRYVLWLRLRRAVEAVGTGASLTAAAFDAGFSDSAHLTRTFQRSFGIPPSALLRMRVVPGWAGDVAH